MPLRNLERWRNEILSRLEDLQARARQNRQLMEANGLNNLEDTSDFEAVWQQIQELFPEDLRPNRVGDLNRHIGFAERHDFSDIEDMDIPAIMESIRRYGRAGDDFIEGELDRVNFRSSISDIIHPRIRDACAASIENREYNDSARIAVNLLMDDLRRLTGEVRDGDALIRDVVHTNPGGMAFSNCQSNNSKKITEGFKQIAQGLYKGVRNTTAHGEQPFGRNEALKIMVTCSLLLSQLQVVEPTDNEQ